MAEETKKWRRVGFTRVDPTTGKKSPGLTFDRKPVDTWWVKFLHAFEDGRHSYQEGQVVEIRDRENLAFYLEHGHCVPSEPAVDTRPKDDGTMCEYQMLDAVAGANFSYAMGQVYALPTRIGDKYVERNLARRAGKPFRAGEGEREQLETGMRASGRGR